MIILQNNSTFDKSRMKFIRWSFLKRPAKWSFYAILYSVIVISYMQRYRTVFWKKIPLILSPSLRKNYPPPSIQLLSSLKKTLCLFPLSAKRDGALCHLSISLSDPSPILSPSAPLPVFAPPTKSQQSQEQPHPPCLWHNAGPLSWQISALGP